MNTSLNRFEQASLRTADLLRVIAQSAPVRARSRLGPEEIDLLVDTVARVLPAGEAPGIVLNGLAALGSEERLTAGVIKRDINLLYTGLNSTLDPAALSAYFSGPAAVLYAYQTLLRLAGRDPTRAFPQGAWQVYTDYALREDTARQAVETRGFESAIQEDRLRLTPADRLAAWLMAAIHILHQYPALLACEWRERTHTALLQEVTAGTPAAAMGAKSYRDWLQQRPYSRPGDVTGPDYAAHRRAAFEAYLGDLTRYLPLALRAEWQRRILEAERDELPPYLLQMSILAYLEPGPFSETRMPLRLSEARVAVALNGSYFFVPVCAEQGRAIDVPPEPAVVRAQAQAILAAAAAPDPLGSGDSLQPLAALRRSVNAGLRARLELANRVGLEALRFAPVLITPLGLPPGDPDRPLARLRQAERGAGDQPLTIFDFGPTMLFDQAASFFDASWGAALAEILTSEALVWAAYFARRAGKAALPQITSPRSFTPRFLSAERLLIQSAPKAETDAVAESNRLLVKPLLALRRRFKRRPDLASLTVSGLLVLYRAIHAATYWPSEALLADLQVLERNPASRAAAGAALDAIARLPVTRPSIVLPLDAAARSPFQRICPYTLEVPVKSLDLITLHRRTLAALDAYQQAQRGPAYQAFDDLQRSYLASLSSFGQVLGAVRAAVQTGQPPRPQWLKALDPAFHPLLEDLPGCARAYKDRMRGGEVFVNVGQVAPTSTVTRFLAARDDQDSTGLVWGLLTDAEDVMHITLRDFRPHVPLLHAAGCGALADRILQAYLDAYIQGFNNFVNDLQRVVQASKETRITSLGG